MSKLEITVQPGDITQIPTDSIMTAINSAGMWYGGVDMAIKRVADGLYHNQAYSKLPVEDLDVIVAEGSRDQHAGQFDNVVFVVDDFGHPVNKVVFEGLKGAHEKGYQSILIPAVRMGLAAGQYEKTAQETVDGITKGIQEFVDYYDDQTSLQKVTFVVYNDPETVKQLGFGFSRM